MQPSTLLLSRREVLAGAAALALAPTLSALSPAMTALQPVPKALDRAQRWIQLALVEKDPATFDPQWWLDFFKRVHADGACISAGGMCAFYPTDVQWHHRSDWLGDKDTFGDLVRGCRKMNMRVIARVDPHCVRDDAAQAHPEWIAVDASGNKAHHMVMTDRWLTCAGALQLRVYAASAERNRRSLRRRCNLRQPLVGTHYLLLRLVQIRIQEG